MDKKFLALLMLFPGLSYGFCFDEAGAYYNVDPKLLKAIATVESNLNPNAYNENKKNNQVVSRDFGLMQINSSWFKRLSEFQVNEYSVYEPCFNVHLGAWILSSNFATHGFNWSSVGAYNAGFKPENEVARQAYIKKVKRHFYQK